MKWTHSPVGNGRSYEKWDSEDFTILRRPGTGAPFRLVAFVDDPPVAGWTPCDGGFFRDFASLADAKAAAERLS